MNYRAAKQEDIDEICAMVRSAVAEMERHHIFQWDSLYPTREDFLADMEKGQLFIGESGADIAVTYVVNRECDDAYQGGNWSFPGREYRVIHRLCVNPRLQNRGIGKDTLLHIERELKKQGVKSVRLDVFSGNPFALSLYRRCGYQEVGSVDWRKGRFWLMEKVL